MWVLFCVYLFSFLFTYKTYWTDLFFQCFSFLSCSPRGGARAGNTAERLFFLLCWHWLVLCSRKYIVFSLDLFLWFSCCFLLLTLMFCLYSLDIRRGENNRFHTHIHICHSCLRVVLCFVLFRFVFIRFAPSLVLCFVLFHIHVCSRLNGSTIRQKGTFKNICVEKLSWLFSVFYFVFTFRSLFAWIILLQFCFCLSFCLSVLFF